MLLYDRVSERLSRDPDFSRDCETFRSSSVYDLSNILPLFPDWERETERRIPRMLPHDYVWAEWARVIPQPGSHFTSVVEFGCWFSPTPANDLARIVTVNPTSKEERRWAFGFHCIFFHRIRSTQIPDIKKHIGELCFSPHAALLTFQADGIEWAYCPLENNVTGSDLPDIFQVGEMTGILNSLEIHCTSYIWPALMSFSLLHCKNIVTENNLPDPRIQRECRKHGRPERVTYKTLRLEVPRTVHARPSHGIGGEDAGPKVRQHLCSGHFRELRSPNYINKRGQWIWIPSHFRGSAELGEVKTRHVLTPANTSVQEAGRHAPDREGTV